MILVTGATGHLGNVIVNNLLKKGKKVRAFVLPKDNIDHIRSEDLEIKYGDITNYESINNAIIGCSYIIHTAAIVSIGNTYKQKDIFKVNVYGLENVLKSALNNNIKKVIYISSIHAFNETKENLLITEKNPIIAKRHKVPYAKSKALAYEVVKKYRQKDLKIDVLFPTGIIGPYDYRKGNNALYPIRQFLNAKKSKQYYFDAGYDFVDVRDVSEVTIKMLEDKTTNNEFIISGQYITLKDIYLTVAKALNKKIKLVKVPNFLVSFGIRFAYFFNKIYKIKMPITPQALKILASKHRISSNKLKTDIGFVPKKIELSLKDTVKFMKENN